MGLTKYADEELQAELKRREKARKKKLCIRCGRKKSEPACRDAWEHTNKEPLPSKQVGDTLYEFTGAFCEGAIAFFERRPYANPYRRRDDRHDEWEYGNSLADNDEVTEKEIRGAYEIAKARKA